MKIKAFFILLTTLISVYLFKPTPVGYVDPVIQVDFADTLGQQQINIPIPDPLNLERIFSDNDFSFAKNNKEIISIITTGDVIPARTVNFLMTKRDDFKFPFAETSNFLKNADLTLINLESPLIDNCPLTNSGMIFCGDKRFIEGLKFADIDAASLGNNHALNYGVDGYCQTVDLLISNGISIVPYDNKIICNNTKNNLSIKEIKGSKIGFLSFNALEKLNKIQLAQNIKKAKTECDFLVVSYHWGGEYLRYPAQETIALAHASIDAGADLIVGNHPHWIQPIEIYNEKLIVYAHGNFIFDQEWSQETKTGIVGKYLLWRSKIIEAKFYPIIIHDYAQPAFLEGEEKTKVLDALKKISEQHYNTIL